MSRRAFEEYLDNPSVENIAHIMKAVEPMAVAAAERRNLSNPQDFEFLLPMRNLAVAQVTKEVRSLLEVAASMGDPLDHIAQVTNQFVPHRRPGAGDLTALQLAERFDHYVSALTAFYLLRATSGEDERWAAAKLLFGTMFPIIGGNLHRRTPSEMSRAFAYQGTDTVILRWVADNPKAFSDAVAMVRGRAYHRGKDWAVKFVREVAMPSFPLEASKRIARDAPEAQGRASLRRFERELKELNAAVAAQFFSEALKAALSQKTSQQQVVSMLFLGGVSHRVKPGEPFKSVPGCCQPELSEQLALAFPMKNGQHNGNVIESYFARPIGEALVTEHFLNFIADGLDHACAGAVSADELSSTRQRLHALWRRQCDRSKDADRAEKTAAFRIFLWVGEETAWQRLNGNVLAELPPGLTTTSSLNCNTVLKEIEDPRGLTRPQVVAIAQQITIQAGTDSSQRAKFWRNFLAT